MIKILGRRFTAWQIYVGTFIPVGVCTYVLPEYGGRGAKEREKKKKAIGETEIG